MGTAATNDDEKDDEKCAELHEGDQLCAKKATGDADAEDMYLYETDGKTGFETTRGNTTETAGGTAGNSDDNMDAGPHEGDERCAERHEGDQLCVAMNTGVGQETTTGGTIAGGNDV